MISILEFRNSNKAFDREYERWSGLYESKGNLRLKRYAIFQKNAQLRMKKRCLSCLALLEPSKNEKILDLGCGTGVLRQAVLSRGASWVGVDISMNMLLEAIQESDSSSTDAHLINGAIPGLSFKNAVFDSVVCIGLINFYPSKQLPSFLDELSRIVKRGGKVVLTSLRLDILTWVRSRLYPKIPLPLSTPGPLFPIHHVKVLQTIDSSDFECVQHLHMRKYFGLPNYTIFRLRKK